MRLPKSSCEPKAKVSARIFDYGAISILFELPIEPGATLASLTPLCDEIYDAPVLEEIGRKEVTEVLVELGDAAEKPSIWHESETFTVVFVRELDGRPKASDILASSSHEIAKLLIGETSSRRLGEEQVADVVGRALSYFEDDLVVIDWNSAFVVEPGGGTEIPQILEFATSQLLEHRYYDSLLDVELARIYQEFERARRRALFRSPYGALARDVLRRLVELWEFTERVDNALKVIGDFYLARVYQTAVKRFRIPAWQASLTEKQTLVQKAYDLLKGDVDIQRSTALEMTIVLLIFVEIVAAFWRH